jgi:hypothetical protein
MKLRKLLFGVSLYAVMSAIWSEPVALHPEAPQSHRVVAGETLWDIAARFLRDPWRWPEVWRTNPQLEDPHLIFPGDRITLSYHAERGPSLELQRELPRYPISPQIRVRELEKAIPTLALDAIQPFLLHSQVVGREALEKAPYVVAGTEERLVLGVGDEVYVRGFSAPTSIPYGIYRSGEAYRDPDSPKRILGYEALFIAAASVRQFGDPAIVRIQNPTREVLIGDRLLPVREREFEYHFFPMHCSGLALGIDAAAHKGALAAKTPTVAVMGTGLDRIYPARHQALAHAITECGVLVSEFPIDTPPAPQHFPRRNRLISGLSLGILVVEAALHSGSLITARLGAEQGREVFAIPGSIHNPLARGCHRLIREGAKLVETAQDILEELGPLAGAARAPQLKDRRGSVAFTIPIDPEYQALMNCLGYDPLPIDALIERSGLTAEAVSSMLLVLELQGRVTALSGGRYLRCGKEGQS